MCTNTCNFASDGECDDGGVGAEFSTSCSFGDDCADCGLRMIPAGATAVVVHEVVIVLTASGDVASYVGATTVLIAQAFADTAGVPLSDVTVTVTSASIQISATIAVQDQAGASAVVANLSPSLSSAASATSMLTTAGVAVSVTSAPTYAANVRTVIRTAPSPPTLTEEEAMGIAVVIAIAVAVVLVVCICLLYWACSRQAAPAKVPVQMQASTTSMPTSAADVGVEISKY